MAIGSYHGKPWVYVGNDGGIYRAPLNGAVDPGGRAKNGQSPDDGTTDTLQYYSVGVGKDRAVRRSPGPRRATGQRPVDPAWPGQGHGVELRR
ncbi:Glycosyl hydrolase [Streptomyces sp. 769]|nr:Glycosyl hydrolase [Streptomyces sp. 769]